MPVSTVTSTTPATASWANSVADSVNGIEGKIYDANGQLLIPWGNVSADKFDTTVPVLQAYGDAAATGGALAAARRDHRHGMPPAPTAESVGAWRKDRTGTATLGSRIWVGTVDPGAAAAEGDVWIKG